MSIHAYEQNRILNASPVELVRILYSAALREVGNARRSLDAGDIASRSRQIGKTQAILFELAASVNPAAGGEIGQRLLSLYSYMQERLLEANLGQKDGPLAEVSALLGTLQQAWSRCEVMREPQLAVA